MRRTAPSVLTSGPLPDLLDIGWGFNSEESLPDGVDFDEREA